MNTQSEFNPSSHPSRRLPWAVSVLLMLIVAGGCAVDIGSDSGARRPTVGQELIDLKRARDAGVISEGEYEAKRQELMGHR
jgi:hypothetical protein